ncbi:hypothetical protein [Pseudomonas carassii]|uniref:Uncharacterized protein n=1 Tax=Pseudomonas carassii TaxID=3115855 RepID=A0ABU7HGJ2_9PSED|nr:hypothetical protein [Pseudomonas sp. 137P]MEE1889756.1 hypothetical protein [Pseudomonas sp. 137P]
MNFSLFRRHVDDIHRAAGIVISKQQLSNVSWPDFIQVEKGDEGTFLEFAKPAIIWNAPYRASSRGNAKRAIAMTGSFNFKDGVFDKGSAHLEVYESSISMGRLTLKILEAMHFDIEAGEKQTAFHPMFHVQFGKSKRWDDAVLRDRVQHLARMRPENIDIVRDVQMPIRDVRIPTPQMDYLSVLVMVIADYFCEKDSANEVKIGFQSLLKAVMSSKNSARVGRQSQTLEQRWVNHTLDRPFAAGHWYGESCH